MVSLFQLYFSNGRRLADALTHTNPYITTAVPLEGSGMGSSQASVPVTRTLLDPSWTLGPPDPRTSWTLPHRRKAKSSHNGHLGGAHSMPVYACAQSRVDSTSLHRLSFTHRSVCGQMYVGGGAAGG